MTVSETQIELGAAAIAREGFPRGQESAGDYRKRLSRAALSAALSDQVVVPKEPTKEMLDNAFVNGPLPMTGLDGSEQAKRERATVAEIYRAMIAAAPSTLAWDERNG